MIRLTSFYQGCANDVKEMVRNMRSQNVDAILLDVSNNGGGMIREFIPLVGFFIETGPIYQMQGRSGFGKQAHNDTDSACEWRGPLVVLANRSSSNAICVAPLQDFGRALVVGDSGTDGKGSVQNMLGIDKNGLQQNSDFNKTPEYGTIKLTIQSIYRVSGKPIDGVGIASDIVLPSMTELVAGNKNTESPVEQIAPVHQYPTFSFVSPKMIAQLKKQSDERIKSSKEFVSVQKSLKQYRERKSVPLNEKKYQAFMKNAKGLSQEKILQQNAASGSKIVRNDYLNEVLAITNDYIHLLP